MDRYRCFLSLITSLENPPAKKQNFRICLAGALSQISSNHLSHFVVMKLIFSSNIMELNSTTLLYYTSYPSYYQACCKYPKENVAVILSQRYRPITLYHIYGNHSLAGATCCRVYGEADALDSGLGDTVYRDKMGMD